MQSTLTKYNIMVRKENNITCYTLLYELRIRIVILGSVQEFQPLPIVSTQPFTMGKKSYHTYGKTFRKPKRAFEKERLDAEMKIIGEYGTKKGPVGVHGVQKCRQLFEAVV